MKPETHLQDSPGLSPEELDVIIKTARRQAESTSTSDDGIDWRVLGYVVLAGSILILLTVQLVG